MPNTLYIEPFSGVAGDMLLSALCDLADAYEEIEKLPQALHLHDGKIEIQTLDKNGIVCRHIKITDTSEETHKHDAHSHSHGAHRHLSDIVSLIENANINDRAKDIAKSIFQIIGESESRIHGIPLEKIHFHEVSGVDSILDIVGCAVLLEKLDIAQTYCDPICVGFGTVKTQHGVLPVPAPATADILKGLPTYKGEEAGERCTPTGAAILKYLNPTFSSPPSPTKQIAYGPGQKNFNSANVVRVSLLENAATQAPPIWVIETNIDDSSSELLGNDFQDGLLAAGAIDFHFTQTLMKKGRPGLLLSALGDEKSRDKIADYILENTSSIGVRYYQTERKILERRKVALETEFGKLLAKESILPSGKTKIKLEYESLKQLAQEHNLSISELQRRIQTHSIRQP
ncbi:nickel pincer cofactor biosynthesis protein LarC [Pelagicoccus mobilis]|uniref:Pyridinium-3,5-bisthiocarboxylic acid mononucleotide nickel insertion protein n=1 Tax=Pelagicoccus mobilis TaxID=415221 RepID=A0A934S094_9BACT|nr:nickel pincer cofactor biosynthesis protein LarC [Pelagicoccus mobilis]MBK1878805.1 nickel pincer cofactor biosynthesis protein LarC [Pelagicoccus mobilis]